MAITASTRPNGKLLHALVLSFPTQGHITPLTQLSRRLVRTKGFIVTFAMTEHTSARSPRSPAAGRLGVEPRPFPATEAELAEDEMNSRIHIVSVPDGLPPHHPRDRGFADQEQAMYGMRRPIELLLRSLQSDPASVVDCIISDIFVTWSFEMASAFELPLVAFYTANATSCSVLYHTRMLMSKGILPFRDEDCTPIDCIPGVPSLLPSEFPPSMQSQDISLPRFRFTLRMFEHIHDCMGLLLNTVYEMEMAAIDALREKLTVFTVGPLFLPTKAEEPLPTQSDVTFWEEDECGVWLDGQAEASVLYVSFGSIATYSEEKFRELAEGLQESKQPFLWVVRRDALNGKTLEKALPEGYMERVKGRGLIVSWAPQLRVLAHSSVGGFLTHCGWNSILESISIGGVPMLCWPDIADQMVNRRLLVDQWKIGLEFEQNEGGVVARKEVVRVVHRLLLSDEGKECRRRAAEWKQCLRRVVQEGGSSSSNLEHFFQSLLS
ncbi:hypothetical protein GOP47_0030247 [Adiantum capillus-veneris]|nr:hypothetical protein GOP47_0030247 [Adiantum capillus-veneris]